MRTATCGFKHSAENVHPTLGNEYRKTGRRGQVSRFASVGISLPLVPSRGSVLAPTETTL